jgi:DNA adenine methylase
LIPQAKNFIEPFVGGGNLTQFIDKDKYENIFCYDVNPYVVAYFQALQDGWLPEEVYTYEFYRELLQDYKDGKNSYPMQLYAHLGFNSTYMAKFMGGTSRLKNSERATIQAYNNAVKDSKWVSGIVFACKSYLDVEIPEDSVIFCDPPYVNTCGYNGTEKFNHEVFYDWCNKQENIYVTHTTMPTSFEVLLDISINHHVHNEGLRVDYKTGDYLYAKTRI